MYKILKAEKLSENIFLMDVHAREGGAYPAYYL